MLPAAKPETPTERCMRRRREAEEFERQQTVYFETWHPQWLAMHEDERESIRKEVCQNEFLRAFRARRGDDEPLFVLYCLDKLKQLTTGGHTGKEEPSCPASTKTFDF